MKQGNRSGIIYIGLIIILAFGLYITYSFGEGIMDTKEPDKAKGGNTLIKVSDAILELANVTEENEDKSTSEGINGESPVKESKGEQAIEPEEKESEQEKNDEKNLDKQEKPKKPDSNKNKPVENKPKPEVNLDNHLNKYVLNIISSYDLSSGSYPYLLIDDYSIYNGVTEDIYYQGQLLLRAHPSGNKASYCTGATFEVFFKAMQLRNTEFGISPEDFNGMNKDELLDMALTWYVALGTKEESNLAVAIEKYGLGERINNLEQVAPGDFIDFNRENNIGHTVVFLEWIREGDKIIGFTYWGSQGSTNGIAIKDEYFNIKKSNGTKYGNVIMDSLNIARVYPINEYRPFK